MSRFFAQPSLRNVLRQPQTSMGRRLFSGSAHRAVVNQVTLIGRVGGDVDTHEFSNGNTVASFSLATSNYYQNKENDLVETTQWHRIKSYNTNSNEWIKEKVKKGAMVYVRGSIRYETYTDKDGNDRNVTVISSERVRKLRDPAPKSGSAQQGAEE